MFNILSNLAPGIGNCRTGRVPAVRHFFQEYARASSAGARPRRFAPQLAARARARRPVGIPPRRVPSRARMLEAPQLHLRTGRYASRLGHLACTDAYSDDAAVTVAPLQLHE